MVTYKQFIVEANFNVNASSRPEQARFMNRGRTAVRQAQTYPAQTQPISTGGYPFSRSIQPSVGVDRMVNQLLTHPMHRAIPVKTAPLKAVPTTPTITTPKIAPSVTARNIPTPVSASKNGRLQPNELAKVGKYNAGAAGKAQWYGDDAYLSPAAAQAFLMAQQSFGGTIKINSAYRNLEHQAGVARQYRVAAAPGRSRHGLGKAIDLQPGTPEYNWMKVNGPRFGWHFAAIKGDPYHFEYRA